MQRLLAQLEGVEWLMATLLYGSALQLLELLRLRVKDADLEYLQITVRDGTGAKDRVTMFPEGAVPAFRRQLERRKLEHRADLRAGGGGGDVHLPFALERKYPAAQKAWAWQYVFAANRLSV